jgi:hypothetical protein
MNSTEAKMMFVCVPLTPPLGVERDAVLALLMQQLETVYQVLDRLPPPPAGAELDDDAVPALVHEGILASPDAPYPASSSS